MRTPWARPVTRPCRAVAPALPLAATVPATTTTPTTTTERSPAGLYGLRRSPDRAADPANPPRAARIAGGGVFDKPVTTGRTVSFAILQQLAGTYAAAAPVQPSTLTAHLPDPSEKNTRLATTPPSLPRLGQR
ncbi:hypothetical protein OG389_11810 [Streptomyces sp. NBC_00435]|uniref:hypothetical protein n=1 Tax=Streptomyces sp. NBC_00435 TaxID=2903649 RepID=UPI002E23547C